MIACGAYFKQSGNFQTNKRNKEINKQIPHQTTTTTATTKKHKKITVRSLEVAMKIDMKTATAAIQRHAKFTYIFVL